MKTDAKKIENYVRLLNYENACKVVDFINKNDKDAAHYNRDNFASITGGGVHIQSTEQGWDEILDFLDSLKVRYEITTQAPHIVEKQIVKDLKEKGII